MKHTIKTLVICGTVLTFAICGCHKKASDESAPVETTPAVQSDTVAANDAKLAENKDEKADEVKEDDAKEKKEVVDKAISSVENGVNIDVHYPELGNPAIDAFLADKAKKDAEAGKKELMDMRKNIPDLAEEPDFDCGLHYEIIRSTPDSADILFTHSQYTGGAHPMAAIETVMLDGKGNVVDPWSLFENPDEELVKMSEEARKQLREKLSHYEDVDSMIHDGTEPKRENFSQMVRTNDGVRIYFNPYDIAPWSEGILYVDYPLNR